MAPIMGYTERERYVTDQVALWIANDGDHYFVARRILADSNAVGMGRYLTRVLGRARRHSAAWHVAQDLAPLDYERIHWADVAAAISDD